MLKKKKVIKDARMTELKENKKPKGEIKNENNYYGISPPKVFKIILDRERSRADRLGDILSFIIFDFSEESNYKLIDTLIRIIKARARAIDKFGWYTEKYMSVILPNTPYTGALNLAHNICEQIKSYKLVPPEYKVFSYPSESLDAFLLIDRQTFKSSRKEKPKPVEGVNSIFTKKMPIWKRSIDIAITLFTLVIISPFLLVVSIIIKTVSKGPILFKQERVGQGGNIFTFLKFRTMKINKDNGLHRDYSTDFIRHNKTMEKLDKKDPRIIPLGKFLRKSCIDELPQLINVLRGDMTLVGPRPCIPYEVKEYIQWHKYRFDVAPGLTGLWQVSGKNRLTFNKMIRLDIYYASNMTFWLDIKILFKTVPAIIIQIIDNIKIEAFFQKMHKNTIPEEKFKAFIKRYFSDIYNVDKLEFLGDKLEKYKVDLIEIMLLLEKIKKISPSYNVAKRYFGICKLIETEYKSQLHIDQNISRP